MSKAQALNYVDRAYGMATIESNIAVVYGLSAIAHALLDVAQAIRESNEPLLAERKPDGYGADLSPVTR